MRCSITSRTFLVAFAFLTAAISFRAAAQRPPVARFERAPGVAPTPGYFIAHQVGDSEQGSDEVAQLSAQDAQLANEAESLAKQLAEATDDKKAELKEKLQDTLSRQFDAQQKARELEVARVEARVKKLRDTIAKRNEARRSIIDKRLDQLLSDAEGLGWNSPAADGGFAPLYLPQPNAGIGGGQPGAPSVIFTTPGRP